MGQTLTLEVPEDVYKLLKKRAEQTGQPPEALAVQLLATATQNIEDDPLEKFIGAFSSSGSDWADHHDKHLGKSVKEEMDTPEHVGPSDA